jgi:hypothetical protein
MKILVYFFIFFIFFFRYCFRLFFHYFIKKKKGIINGGFYIGYPLGLILYNNIVDQNINGTRITIWMVIMSVIPLLSLFIFGFLGFFIL